jgi:hypothetical protein
VKEHREDNDSNASGGGGGGNGNEEMLGIRNQLLLLFVPQDGCYLIK